MKGVFKNNEELKYLKEEFKTFVENKETKESSEIINEILVEDSEVLKETLVLEEV